jgi:membrane-bound lytic murein transglycosylase B
VRVTADLGAETVRKKEATIALADARVGLRTLAVASYVNGPQDPDDAFDVDEATKVLGHRALTQVVSEQQVTKLRSSQNALNSALGTMNADLVARTDGRVRMSTVQAEHDRAVRDVDRLTRTLVELKDAVERARVTANVVGADFALVAIDAYWKAASVMTSDDPDCGITWWALAGITRVESRHGTYGGAHLLANGDVDKPIIGIPLDGTNNTAVIEDTDGGQYDGDPEYDHAVGPMQFIPSTWRRWAHDGNGDRVKDPNNIYDAADAAAHYLCASGPMKTDDDMRRGFYSYNHSDSYAETVLNYAKGYSRFRL